MADYFDPIEYLAFLRRNAKFAAIAIGTAVLLTAAVSFLLPKQYTATATLVIEPPAGTDARGATAVSAIYLESLKAYEQLAASDSLFERARQKFHLEEGSGSAATETLRKRVLRVVKLPDTKVLQIKATLPDAKQSQALVQFLAEETVALNRSVENQSEHEALTEVRKQVEVAGAKLAQTRADYNAAVAEGAESVLGDEVRNLSDLKGRLNEQLANAATSLAELSARADAQTKGFSAGDSRENLQQDIAAARARSVALSAQMATVSRSATQLGRALTRVRISCGQPILPLKRCLAAPTNWPVPAACAQNSCASSIRESFRSSRVSPMCLYSRRWRSCSARCSAWPGSACVTDWSNREFARRDRK